MSVSHLSFLAVAAAVALATPAFADPAPAPPSGKYWVFIGTYTAKDGSEGIYRCELDVKTGALGKPELAAKVASPSFLAISPNNKFLYAVGETVQVGDKKEGLVHAYALDAATGSLTKLNEKPTGGSGPCHVSVNRSGKYVIMANYGGGSSAVYSLKDDGSLGDRTHFRQHEGKSANPQRQEAPHAHCSIFVEGADGEFAYVVDLGLDKVFSYKLDEATGTLTPTQKGSTDLPPGSGPRHIAINKNSGKAYVCGEMDCMLYTLRWDRNTGDLEKSDVAAAPTLPRPVAKGDSTAEVIVHPSNGYVLVSNRGHDSLAVFRVKVDTTERVAHITSAGDTKIRIPRNFNADPTGKWLLIASQDGNTVDVAEWSDGNGKLTGNRVDVSRPVCIKFVPKQ